MFKQAYIPRTLTEVSHYERDVDVMKEESAVKGHHDSVRTPEGLERSQSPDSNVDSRAITKTFPQILYQTLTGLKKDLSGVQKVKAAPLGPNELIQMEFTYSRDAGDGLHADGPHESSPS